MNGSRRRHALLVAAASLVAACSDRRAPLDSVELTSAPSSGPTVETDACEEREVIESDAPVVDSLLALFADTPIVAFGERHGSRNEHRVLQALVCDRRFADVVDVIIVEFGNARLQDVIDRYVGGDDIDADELATIWRETTQRSGVWEAPVYRQFFDIVRSVNQGRGPKSGFGCSPVTRRSIGRPSPTQQTAISATPRASSTGTGRSTSPASSAGRRSAAGAPRCSSPVPGT
jgi:hypothetical protein